MSPSPKAYSKFSYSLVKTILSKKLWFLIIFCLPDSVAEIELLPAQTFFKLYVNLIDIFRLYP